MSLKSDYPREIPLIQACIDHVSKSRQNEDVLKCQMKAIIEFCKKNSLLKDLAVKLEKCEAQSRKKPVKTINEKH